MRTYCCCLMLRAQISIRTVVQRDSARTSSAVADTVLGNARRRLRVDITENQSGEFSKPARRREARGHLQRLGPAWLPRAYTRVSQASHFFFFLPNPNETNKPEHEYCKVMIREMLCPTIPTGHYPTSSHHPCATPLWPPGHPRPFPCAGAWEWPLRTLAARESEL